MFLGILLLLFLLVKIMLCTAYIGHIKLSKLNYYRMFIDTFLYQQIQPFVRFNETSPGFGIYSNS